MSDGAEHTAHTSRCGCSPERHGNADPTCGRIHLNGRFVCTKPIQHDGLHSACTPKDHPLKVWREPLDD